jgi:GT2 family glycosyltransferase
LQAFGILKMADLPSVSVIVPHYRDFVHLDICLKSLAAQTYPADRVQVIVGDNASPEGIERVREVVAGRADVVVVQERGAGPARNGAVAHATGDVLAFIDSDCVAEPQWLAQGVRALADHDFVGGRVKVLVDDEARMTPVEAWERVFAFDFKTYIEKKGFTGSGNLFCPRKLFETVGGFRVGLSEDTEWSLRARAQGYGLGYAPNAVVGHPARRTWDELTRKWRRLNEESFGLSRERRGYRLRWLVRNLLMPASALVHTPKVLLHPGLHSTGQRLGALRVLYAIRLWRLGHAIEVLRNDGRRVKEA